MRWHQANSLCNVPAVARTIVTMEQTYITAAFFRHLQYARYRAMEMAQFDEGHQQLAAGLPALLLLQFLSQCCILEVLLASSQLLLCPL